MTEVPEHLLARSRERRSALGQGGGDAPAPAAASSGSDAGGSSAAAATPAVAAAAAAPAVVEAAPPPPPPPYVQAALDRKKAPRYMGPVGVAILLWAFIYAGVMFTSDEITDPVLAEGGEIFAAQCAGCHGGAGQGGTGRPLHDILETFPDPADHIGWVTNGSPAKGTVYGANGHTSQDAWPAMPAFGNALTPEQIIAVVRYEREVLNGETESTLASGEAPAAGEGGGAGDPADSPSAEAESDGGDTGGSSGSSADSGEESQSSGNESATDDASQDDSGTGSQGETDTGE